jgi:hypothetical protein
MVNEAPDLQRLYYRSRKQTENYQLILTEGWWRSTISFDRTVNLVIAQLLQKQSYRDTNLKSGPTKVSRSVARKERRDSKHEE